MAEEKEIEEKILKTRALIKTDRIYLQEQFCIYEGQACVRVRKGFYSYNRVDNTWMKPSPKAVYIPVTERGFVKKLKIPIVLREDHLSKVAGIISNSPIFTKLNFTVTVREDQKYIYLLKQGRKLYVRDFGGLGSCEECGWNSNEDVLVKEGRRTQITREQAIELIKKGSPMYMGLIRTKAGFKVWISKVSA